LRAHKRKELFVPTLIQSVKGEMRGTTLNISWEGMFIIDMNPEQYSVEKELTVWIPDFELDTEVCVVWVNPWGQRKAPGIGVKFISYDEKLEQALLSLLRSNRCSDRDRLVI
jgi:Tfp pilus assembly protein PilZ